MMSGANIQYLGAGANARIRQNGHNRWPHVPLLDLMLAAGITLRERRPGRYEGDHGYRHASKSGACLWVRTDEGRWGCSSCGQGGDAAAFVADWQGLPYADACAWLEARYGSAPNRYAELPWIDASAQDVRLLAEQAWAAIRRLNDPAPTLFRFGGQLVRLERGEDGALVPVELSEARTAHLLARAANWYKPVRGGPGPGDGDGAGGGRVIVRPPGFLVRDLLADPEPPLPVLRRIVEAPVLGPDGALQTIPGYHPENKTYYDPPPGLQVPPVPEAPTDADMARARSLLLDDLLVDFPFVSDADRAHAVALLLLPLVRDLIPGPTPLHLIEAPTEGSGKGLLAEVCLLPAYGRRFGALPAGRDGDEWRKAITSVLRAGHGAVVIDNIVRPLDSGDLAAALTATTWEDRLLGKTELLRLPVRCVWVATANNPVVSREIMRRCVRIRIDPRVDEPWRREGFKHAPLRAWAETHRGELIWAALTLVQHWLAQGRPPASVRPLGSFEAWAEVLGGILHAAGIPGFLQNLDEFYREANTETAAWRAFVAAWWEQFAQAPVLARELLPLALEVDGLEVRGKDEAAQARSLGKKLEKMRDRVIGGYRIERAGTDARAIRWRLRPPGPAPGPDHTRRPSIQHSPNSGNSPILTEDGPPARQRTGPAPLAGGRGAMPECGEFPEFGEYSPLASDCDPHPAAAPQATTQPIPSIQHPPNSGNSPAAALEDTGGADFPPLSLDAIAADERCCIPSCGRLIDAYSWDGRGYCARHLPPPLDDPGARPASSAPSEEPPASPAPEPDHPSGDGDAHTGAGAANRGGESNVAVGPSLPPFELLTDPGAVREVLPELVRQPALGVDTETTGLDPRTCRLRLVQFATPERVYLIDCFRVPPAALGPLFADPRRGPVLIGHNLKFDLSFLWAPAPRLAGAAGPGWAAGLVPPQLAGVPPHGTRLFDTLLADQLVRGGQPPRSLKDLAAELGLALDKSFQEADWGGELSPAMLQYAAQDAAVLLPLYRRLHERLQALDLQGVAELEMRALPAVTWLEQSGCPFDFGPWEALAEQAQAERDRLAAELSQMAGAEVNWDSVPQVLAALRAAGLDLPDTREETLCRHAAHPLVSRLLAYREATKRAGTYGRDWLRYASPATGRVHADWHQIGAQSGRMACRNPNLQNLPRDGRYRACIRPGEGWVLVKADYAQIELRIAAELAGERRMIAAFRRGENLHRRTAALVLDKSPDAVTADDRQLAKAINFGLLYGMGPRAFAAHALQGYGVRLTEAEAAALREKFFQAYPALRRWHRAQPRGAMTTKTIVGRKRFGVQRFTEKLNTPVQGSGADGLKLALALLWETRDRERARCPQARPILCVHDEIVVEVPADAAAAARQWLVDCMTRGMQAVLREVPVEVEAMISRDLSGASP